MKKINLQLHITPDEVIEFVNSIKQEFGLYITVMGFNPFRLEERTKLSTSDMTHHDYFIFFTLNKPNLNATSQYGFFDANTARIKLVVGKLYDSKLQESALFSTSETKEEVVIANKVASKLKKLTKAGAKIIDSETKIEHNYPRHRYTAGAQKMYKEGIKMLDIGGGNFLELGKL